MPWSPSSRTSASCARRSFDLECGCEAAALESRSTRGHSVEFLNARPAGTESGRGLPHQNASRTAEQRESVKMWRVRSRSYRFGTTRRSRVGCGIYDVRPAGMKSGRGLPHSKTLRERLTRAGSVNPHATHSNDFRSADLGSVRTSMRWSSVARIPPRRIARPSR